VINVNEKYRENVKGHIYIKLDCVSKNLSILYFTRVIYSSDILTVV
jgi:hypothetical protein